MEFLPLILKLSVIQFVLFFAMPMLCKKSQPCPYAIKGLL